jgi:tRNA pseudouridine55 synthase
MTKTTSPVHGVVVVDKPPGPTSHDVIDIVRRALGTRRVGHTGTLDPFASGVLPVCVGKATRLVQFLSGGPKVYRATVRLGLATTTDDLHGDPLGEPRPVNTDREAIAVALRELTGEILQLPPIFSAKRTDGRRHHELARAGRPVDREPCRVTVESIDVVSWSGEDLEIQVRCGAGTYIRALARDIGERLGTGGHLVVLRRLQSGPFTLEHAVEVETVRAGGGALLPFASLLSELPAVRIAGEGLNALRFGRDLSRAMVIAGFPESAVPRLRVVDDDGRLVALAVPKGFGLEIPGVAVEPMLHPDLVFLED